MTTTPKPLDLLERWLEDWITKISSPYIDVNGPKCPYAKSALDSNRVKIVKMPGAVPADFWARVVIESDNLNNDIDVIVVATELNEKLYGHYFVTNGGVDALNYAFNVQNKNVWLLSASNDLYSTVLIQRLTDLDDASKKLEQQGGYYKRMDPAWYEKFVTQRRILRERLK
jgi:hypothetical protein